MIEKNTAIIRKIMALKNVNILTLLHYGLDHNFINGDFCSAVATEIMNLDRMIDNPYVIELAGLMSNEYDKANTIIQQATQNNEKKHETQKLLFNKIWFYLFLVDDLCKHKVI